MPLLIRNELVSLAKQQAEYLLELVGLKNRLQHKVGELSGGEKQRVGIARAVVNKPDLLLADEPTGNLDPALSAEIMRLFEQFNQVGVALLIASHDLSLIASLRHRIITLDNGKVISDGLKGEKNG